MPERALLALVLVLLGYAPALGDAYGRFEGQFRATFLPDGLTVRLEETLRYVEPHGVVWEAPAGLISDGASIPRLLWSVVGGPFSGKYRTAAIVHDRYCETMDRPWQQVHRAFYTASRAAGVSEAQALLMYYAVYRFGPRWEISRSDDTSRIVFRPRAVPAELDEMRQRIEQGAIDLRGIEAEADRSLGGLPRSFIE